MECYICRDTKELNKLIICDACVERSTNPDQPCQNKPMCIYNRICLKNKNCICGCDDFVCDECYIMNYVYTASISFELGEQNCIICKAGGFLKCEECLTSTSENLTLVGRYGCEGCKIKMIENGKNIWDTVLRMDLTEDQYKEMCTPTAKYMIDNHWDFWPGVRTTALKELLVANQTVLTKKDMELFTQYKRELEKQIIEDEQRFIIKLDSYVKMKLDEGQDINAIRSILKDNNLDKYLSNTLTSYIKQAHCSICSYILEQDGRCTKCNKISCDICLSVYDASTVHVCDQEVVERIRKYKSENSQCPRCNIVVEKSYGCDVMFCVYCGVYFSYSTKMVISKSHNPEAAILKVPYLYKDFDIPKKIVLDEIKGNFGYREYVSFVKDEITKDELIDKLASSLYIYVTTNRFYGRPHFFNFYIKYQAPFRPAELKYPHWFSSVLSLLYKNFTIPKDMDTAQLLNTINKFYINGKLNIPKYIICGEDKLISECSKNVNELISYQYVINLQNLFKTRKVHEIKISKEFEELSKIYMIPNLMQFISTNKVHVKIIDPLPMLDLIVNIGKYVSGFMSRTEKINKYKNYLDTLEQTDLQLIREYTELPILVNTKKYKQAIINQYTRIILRGYHSVMEAICTEYIVMLLLEPSLFDISSFVFIHNHKNIARDMLQLDRNFQQRNMMYYLFNTLPIFKDTFKDIIYYIIRDVGGIYDFIMTASNYKINKLKYEILKNIKIHASNDKNPNMLPETKLLNNIHTENIYTLKFNHRDFV